MVEEDEDAIQERKLEEALAGIDDKVVLDEERNVEDVHVPIHKGIPSGTPSRPNVDCDLAFHFTQFDTWLDSMHARFMSPDE